MISIEDKLEGLRRRSLQYKQNKAVWRDDGDHLWQSFSFMTRQITQRDAIYCIKEINQSYGNVEVDII